MSRNARIGLGAEIARGRYLVTGLIAGEADKGNDQFNGT